jgi:hypothetical protein
VELLLKWRKYVRFKNKKMGGNNFLHSEVSLTVSYRIKQTEKMVAKICEGVKTP